MSRDLDPAQRGRPCKSVARYHGRGMTAAEGSLAFPVPPCANGVLWFFLTVNVEGRLKPTRRRNADSPERRAF